MAKINILMADSDDLYLNKLANYLMEKTSDFEVCSFTSKESMIRYISDKSNRIDIIIFSEDLFDETINISNVPVKILLADGTYTNLEGFEKIDKYQKAEKFINDIRLIYADKTGHVEAVKTGDKNTKIIGIYSPIGGCGKTTISIALGMSLAKQGIRVFYFNCEDINSTAELFNKAQNGNMSDIFLAMKTKGGNVDFKIIASKCEDSVTKINYINPAESSLELNELSNSELKDLIKEFGEISEFDVVIVDFDSSFNKRKMELLSVCDEILMPFCQDTLSINKINTILNEFRIHEELEDVAKKVHLFINKADSNQNMELGQINMEIEASIPVASTFYDLKNLIYNQGSQEALNPLINIVFQE